MKIRISFYIICTSLVFLLFACANAAVPSSENNTSGGGALPANSGNSLAPFAGSYSSSNGSYNFNSDGTGTMGGANPSARSAGGITPFTWEITVKDANNANVTYGMLYVGNAGSGITFDTGKTPHTVTINGTEYGKGGLPSGGGTSSGGDNSGSGGQQDGGGSQGGSSSGGQQGGGNGSQDGGSSGGGNNTPSGNTPTGSTPESQPTLQPNGNYLLFAPGVTMTSGWHDATKTQSGGGYSFSEVNLCWAATSANVIAWWQDRYNALHPTQKISSELPQTAQNIFQKFKSCWTDDTHGGFKDGVPWYMAGIASGAKENGGYLIDYIDIKQWNLLFGVTAYKYAENKNIATLSDFSKEIIAGLKKGAIALGISNNSGTGHAITIWGAEYNSQNLVTAIWVSDSDDLKIGAQGLVKYTVSQENGYVKIHNHYYGYDRIKNILILYAP